MEHLAGYQEEYEDKKKTEKQQNGHPGRYMATPRRFVLEVGIRRVVDWPSLLTRQLEDVIVYGRNIDIRLETI